jgi:hypothetical protein
VELVIIDFSSLRISDDLTRFVEALQGKIVGGKILVRSSKTSVMRISRCMRACAHRAATVRLHYTRVRKFPF